MNPTNTGMLGNIQMGGGGTPMFGGGQPQPMLSVGQPQAAQPTPGRFGNLPPPQPPGSFAQRFGQLHPQAQQALRQMPPEVMQHLHENGMIHPGIMDHIRGSNPGPMSNTL